jgi:hypothetical protein
MSIDKNKSADKDDLKDLTREEARRKLEHFLAITEENTRADEGTFDEIDSADSTMATLILPGG